MGEFGKKFEGEFLTPFGKKNSEELELEKAEGEKINKSAEEKKYAVYLAERKEEKGYYDMLKEELKDMQRGGVDLHFGKIDVDKLEAETLDFYRKYKKHKIDELEIKDFMKKTYVGSNDYNFAAMLLNWKIGENYNKKRR